MRTPRAPHGARPVGRIPKEYEEDKEDEKMRDSNQRVEFPFRAGPHDASCSRAGLHLVVPPTGCRFKAEECQKVLPGYLATGRF